MLLPTILPAATLLHWDVPTEGGYSKRPPQPVDAVTAPSTSIEAGLLLREPWVSPPGPRQRTPGGRASTEGAVVAAAVATAALSFGLVKRRPPSRGHRPLASRCLLPWAPPPLPVHRVNPLHNLLLLSSSSFASCFAPPSPSSPAPPSLPPSPLLPPRP